MIEVEVKLPVEDMDRIREQLLSHGFQRIQLLREEDHYYDNADNQIRNNGEALRIRKTTDLETMEEKTLITFKGKKIDQVSMTRKELETEVEEGAVFAQILESLGYHEVPPAVIKIRDELSAKGIHACLDEVQDLGSFLELEIVMEEGERKEEALQKIEKELKALGYQLSDTTRTSYLTQLQKKRKG